MKRLLLIVLAAALLIACRHAPINTPGPGSLQPSQSASQVELDAAGILSEWQGLSMYVPEGSVTPTGMRLSLINSSATEFGYGAEFRIEQYSQAGWEQMPFTGDFGWVSLLFIVAPNTTEDENISWEYMLGELQPGQYRIVRNFIKVDFSDPTPMWEQDIPDAYLYAAFTVTRNWQAAHSRWQSEQDDVAAVALARFEGLDLEILEYSSRGLSFTLTNNNPTYGYIIDSVFVGWEDAGAGSVEYSIFPGWTHGSDSWPFGEDMRLGPGEHLSLEVDWYNQMGRLSPAMLREPDRFYVFELFVDVTLDVDAQYIRENFRHTIPGLPNAQHRIKASFDISP